MGVSPDFTDGEVGRLKRKKDQREGGLEKISDISKI